MSVILARSALALVGLLCAVAFFVAGGFLLISGFMLCLTFVMIPFGMPLIVIGWSLLAWAWIALLAGVKATPIRREAMS